MSKIYAIGDIHGCADKLYRLLEKVNIDLSIHKLVFMGDYIDRGKQSYEVVQFLIGMKDTYPNIIFLKGNHEEMLEKYLLGQNRYLYLVNGGQQALESYLNRSEDTNSGPIPTEHIEYYRSLSLYHETEDYIFVHAGLKEGVKIEQQVPDDLLWIRRSFIHSDYDFGKTVIFGHTPFSEPFIQNNKIGIDTGCVFGNKLTCVELPDMKFYQV